jgi:hypothetical protein
VSPAFQLAIDGHDPHGLVRSWAAAMDLGVEDHDAQIREPLAAGIATDDGVTEGDGPLVWATAAAGVARLATRSRRGSRGGACPWRAWIDRACVDRSAGGPLHAHPDEPRPHLGQVLRSQMICRPLRVSHGSWWSIVSHASRIAGASPPVATVVTPDPSSLAIRWTMPSTCPAKP